jgi:hypothetical protein
MPQTLRNCFRSFSRVVQAMKSLLPTAKPPLPLQENLDRAQPAESAWDHHDYADGHETRCLYSHAEPRDGLWRCCNCLHEHEVTHFRGPHPFKIVECPCAHTLCTTCCTTEILTPVRSMATEVFERRSRTVFNGEVLYCRVCPCGLTHRAVRNGNSLDCQDEPCDCGEPVDAGNYYFIGSVHEYRRDPLRRANEVMEEHIEKSSARQMARLGLSSTEAPSQRTVPVQAPAAPASMPTRTWPTTAPQHVPRQRPPETSPQQATLRAQTFPASNTAGSVPLGRRNAIRRPTRHNI